MNARAGLNAFRVAALAAAALALFSLPAAAAPPMQVSTVEVASGAFYEEAIYAPANGSAWSVSAVAVNGTGPFDVYIIPTTDLISAYPGGAFSPLIAYENQTSIAFNFTAPSRLQSFTLVIDNTDNARTTDAPPAGPLTVHLERTPPLRSNPEAQALLGTGAGICAVGLAFSAVAVAIYLKRKPRADHEGELDAVQPRMEIDIEVPPPPRGAWARAAEESEAPPEAGK